ncbi:MAG: RsmG family class I SAM-dependent methyltransferase, partial [Pseudomonadota bacterium]
GLILAIGAPGPGWEVSLIESNSKKVGFLRWVAADLGVQVRIVPERIEQVIELNVDVVVSRALADLPGLLGYAAPLVSNGGWCCFHKGQDVDEELTRATKYWRFEHQKRVSRVAGGGCVLTIRNLSPRPVGAA